MHVACFLQPARTGQAYPPDEPDGAPWERHACLRATDATSFPLNAPQEQNILWLAKDKVQPPTIALAIKIFKARVS